MKIYPQISNKRIFYNPERYLKFLREKPDDIEQVRIVSPKLGKKGFGYIEVKTKNRYGSF